MNQDSIRRSPQGLLSSAPCAHHARPEPGGSGFEPLTDEEIEDARASAGFPRSGVLNRDGIGTTRRKPRERGRLSKLAPWTDERSPRGWKLGEPDPPDEPA